MSRERFTWVLVAWFLLCVCFVVAGSAEVITLITDEQVVKRLVPFTPAHCWTMCVGANEIQHTAGFLLDPANDSYGFCAEIYKATPQQLECHHFFEACVCVDGAGGSK